MYLKVTVQPDARADAVIEKNGRYIISTRAPKREGRANGAALELLANYLKCPVKTLSIIRGTDRPSKLVLKRD